MSRIGEEDLAGVMTGVRELTGAVYPRLDLSREIQAVRAQRLGDTISAAVAKIAAVIDGLRQLADTVYSCPAEAGSPLMLTAMQLTFRSAPGGPVVATVSAGYTGCQFAWVTVGAHTVWPLQENTSSGQPVQQQVLAIADIRWPYPPG